MGAVWEYRGGGGGGGVFQEAAQSRHSVYVA